MKNYIHKFLLHRYFIGFHIVAISAAFLSYVGVLALYTGLLIVLITLWSSNWNWELVSFKTSTWRKSFKQALLLAIPVYGAVFIIHEVVETYIGSADLSSFDAIRGKPDRLILIILFSWISASLGEELFFRGYLLNRVKQLFYNSKISTLLALLISSIVFSFAHLYQGIPGVVKVFLVGVLLGIIFIKYKNLKLVILLHAIIDTISLLLLYFDVL